MSQPGEKINWQDIAWEQGFKTDDLEGDDKAMFIQWYHDEHMSMVEIGKRIDICATTISRRMRHLKIEVRPPKNHNCGRGPRLPKGKI
jgi:hypothetical protein